MSFHPLCLWKGTLTADSHCVNVGLIPAICCCVSKCHSCDYRFPLFLSGSHLSFSSCRLLFFLLLFFFLSSLSPALLVIPLFSPSFLSPFLLSLCFSNTVFDSFVMSFAIHTWFVNELSGNYNHYFSLWNLFWIDANLISTIYTGSACRQLGCPPLPLCSTVAQLSPCASRSHQNSCITPALWHHLSIPSRAKGVTREEWAHTAFYAFCTLAGAHVFHVSVS